MAKKKWLPKVGDTFYWKNLDGEIQEGICQHIEYDDNTSVETLYFIHYTEASGVFIAESDILNPNSKQVQKYIAKQDKKAYREFWTERHFNDMLNHIKKYFITEHEMELAKIDLEKFIKSKSE